jgi:hypothetical protein
MKGRMFVCCAVMVLLSVLPAGVWAQGDVLPKGDEELYGTWVNGSGAPDLFHGQKAVVSAEEMQVFARLDDQAPGMLASWEIHRKWTDSEGNVWYETFGTATGGVYKGLNWQALEKISKSGSGWERAVNMLELGSFNPAFYPKTIDTKAAYYRVLYRVED